MTDGKNPQEPMQLSDEELEGVAGGTLPPEMMPLFVMLSRETKDHALQYLDGESEQTSMGFLIEALENEGKPTWANVARSYYESHYGKMA